MSRPSVLASLAVLGLLAACGGDDDGGGDADAATDDADAAPELHACPGDSEAIAADEPVEGAIAEPGERDAYLFSGTAGTWLLIDIDANPANELDQLDSFLRLHGPDGEVIASNDDALPVGDRDSEIVTRLPADGDYCIEVMALSDADGDDDTEPQGDPSHTYALIMVEVDESDEFATIDPEDGDELADAVGVTFGPSYRYILGELDADDEDFFTFTMPDVGGDTEMLSGYVLPPNASGTGSTSAARSVSIVSDDPEEGSPTVALINHSAGQRAIAPPLREGAYYVRVQAPPSAIGDNGFYVIKARRDPENPIETGEGNESIGTAEALTMNDVDGVSVGFITAELDDGDIDYFSFDVTNGQHARITCSAASAGSGVRGLHVALRDDADANVAQADEAPDEPVVVETDIEETATYAMRLSADTPDVAVVSRYVRCGVRLEP